MDGEIHNLQKEKDVVREEVLIEKGYKIIRFMNEDILKNIDNVLNEIREFFRTHPLGREKNS